MSTKTEALQQFFAAINRNDIQATIKDFDPEIVRIEFEGSPTGATYRGIADVQAHIKKGRGTWAEGICEPEKFLESGDKVVVYLHASVRLKMRPNGLADDLLMASCFVMARLSNITLSGNGQRP